MMRDGMNCDAFLNCIHILHVYFYFLFYRLNANIISLKAYLYYTATSHTARTPVHMWSLVCAVYNKHLKGKLGDIYWKNKWSHWTDSEYVKLLI